MIKILMLVFYTIFSFFAGVGYTFSLPLNYLNSQLPNAAMENYIHSREIYMDDLLPYTRNVQYYNRNTSSFADWDYNNDNFLLGYMPVQWINQIQDYNKLWICNYYSVYDNPYANYIDSDNLDLHTYNIYLCKIVGLDGNHLSIFFEDVTDDLSKVTATSSDFSQITYLTQSAEFHLVARVQGCSSPLQTVPVANWGIGFLQIISSFIVRLPGVTWDMPLWGALLVSLSSLIVLIVVLSVVRWILGIIVP